MLVGCLFFPEFHTALAAAKEPRLAGEPLGVFRDGRVVSVTTDLEPYRLIGLTPAKARGRCPDALFVEYDPGLYAAAHEWYLEALTRFSPVIEPLDQRECFFDLTGADPGSELPQLRRKISRRRFGRAAVGLGPNKLVARLAALAAAENAAASFQSLEVHPGMEMEFMRSVPVARDWLLPEDAIRASVRLGFTRFGDLQQFSASELAGWLGPHASPVYRHARGIETAPLKNLYPPPGMTWSKDFPGSLADFGSLRQALQEGALALAGDAERRNEGFRKVRLTVATETGCAANARNLPRGCQSGASLAVVLQNLLGKLELSEPVTGVEIGLSSFYAREYLQEEFFSPAKKGGNKLLQVISALNDKYPGRLDIGLPVTRRERVFSLWDSWRQPR